MKVQKQLETEQIVHNCKRAKELTTAIAHMITLDLQPFSIVDDVGFRSLLNCAEPRYDISSRSTFFRNIIPCLYEDLKKGIMTKIHTDSRK
ncbi:Zinc finger BED domain-containing protein 4 [Melipona quadrifasciata]|uniref:Zinc finger BED domain-containing protein 4 n=1 Tax=Melipona quadrifasciata TaxID=166423 RepID=A0A0N0BDC3_9HYME|nr:Zinc finger BED domain-containing protein 4 [Melipona quadrifasciata]